MEEEKGGNSNVSTRSKQRITKDSKAPAARSSGRKVTGGAEDDNEESQVSTQTHTRTQALTNSSSSSLASR